MQALKLYLGGITLSRISMTVKLEVDLTITNPITSNNFCNLLADLIVGYSHPQEGTLFVSSIIASIMQYSQAVPSFSFLFFIQLAPLPAGKEFFSFISV